MSSTTPRKHAYTESNVPQLPEPSYAERTRTLVALTSIATLSTISRKHPGYPFGSLMPYALDPEGRPIFLISNMAMHTQNLQSVSQASLFVGQVSDGDPLGAARTTLIGDAAPIPDIEVAAARELYLARYENSRSWVDFKDFSFYRLQPIDIYYVGGFGVMGWVTVEDYKVAKEDPLASSASGIISHMNTDHVAAMLQLAKAYANIEATEATMTAVDRLGFFLRLRTAEGMKGVRINYPREVVNAQETRQVFIEMIRSHEAKA
jgi:heme oxygenase (biliverdin-IX-beta and delta-forming)